MGDIGGSVTDGWETGRSTEVGSSDEDFDRSSDGDNDDWNDEDSAAAAAAFSLRVSRTPVKSASRKYLELRTASWTVDVAMAEYGCVVPVMRYQKMSL